MPDIDLNRTLLIQLALTLLLGGLLVAMVLRGLATFATRLKIPVLALSPLKVAIKWLGIFIILAICLDQLGIHLATYIATILGLVAIGFVAVWSILSHVTCTFLLILLKPFQVGDEVGFIGEEVSGRVVDLNLVFTTLRTPDGFDVQVPNNQFFQKVMRRRKGPGRVTLGEQLYEAQPAE